MPPRTKHDPMFGPALAITEPLAALGEPHRFLLFHKLVMLGGHATFQTLQKELHVHKVALSRAMKLFEKAKLVTISTNLDRSKVATVNMQTLDKISGVLGMAYARLSKTKNTAEES
jgi:hypothetical protein